MKLFVHLVGIAVVTGATVAVAETGAPPPAQTISLGDAHVQSHLPVAFVVAPEIQQLVGGALKAMANGAASAQVAPITTSVSIELVWRPGAPDQRVLPLDSGAVLLPITPHRGETYTYFVRIRDETGQFEARFPTAPAVFRIEAAIASGPTVLDGTGDGEAGRGERIPIHVRLANPDRVKDVVLFHRSAPAAEWTSAPMVIKASAENDATWSVMVQRPLGGEREIEYYVRATGVDGHLTNYGVPDRPHRLKLVAPPLAADPNE